MSKTAVLLRPFVFCRAAPKGQNATSTEQKFTPKKDPHTGEWIPTEIELPDDAAEHDFIKVYFADGCIERPEITAKRLRTAQERRKAQDEVDARELKKAEEALARAGASQAVRDANENAVTRELNTPVNELGAAQGMGLSVPINEMDLELDTPVNELRAGKLGKKS